MGKGRYRGHDRDWFEIRAVALEVFESNIYGCSIQEHRYFIDGQISPAPMAIFNKQCEILDWIYEIYLLIY